MVISTHKYVILALLGLGCLGAYPIYQSLQMGQISQKTAILESFLSGNLAIENKQVKEVLAEELAQEHAKLLNAIQKAFNLPDDQWKETLESIAEVKQEDTLLIGAELYKENKDEHEAIRLAKSILAHAGMNPDHVKVYISNKPEIKTNAGAGQGYTKDGVIHELEINEPNFCQKSPQDQVSIIKHEIRHLYYYDGLERALLMALANKHGIDAKTFKDHETVKAYFKFQEFRADLTAAIESLETAYDFKNFFKYYIEKNIYPHYKNGKSSASHPTDEERFEMIDRLIQYLEAEKINDGNEPSSLEETYKSKFEEERKNILEEIRKEFNIPQEKWDKGFVYFDYVCEQNKDILKENCKPATNADELINRIKHLLAKNGINPDKVAIEFNAEYGWPVATYQRARDYDLTCSISINKEWFSQQSVALQNAIISHEIMHLKHFDVFELNLILGILEANGITPTQYKDSKSLQKYHHLREMRADLMAGLHDIEVAKALHQDFCNCVEDKFTGDLSEHPSNQVRMDQMAHLIKDLEQQTIKIA